MIRIVGSDIGGTLTNQSGEISRFTRQVLARVPVPLCLVTGYNRHVAFQYRDMIDHPDLYLVAQNGAFAYHGKELLFSRLVSPDVVTPMVNCLLTAGCAVRVFCTDNQVYCIRPDGYVDDLLRWDEPIYHDYDGRVEDLPPVIQVCAFERVERIRQVIPLAQESFGDGCIIGSLLYGTHQWIELSHGDARKEIAFPELLRILRIDLGEAMFCGDNYNDMDVLKQVGHAVVVGDAPMEIRQIGDVVTGPGYADGIAHYLNEYFRLGILHGTD